MASIGDFVGNPAVQGALITTAISLIVGYYFGARAAAASTLKQNRRSAHHSTLVGTPIDQIVSELQQPDLAVEARLEWSRGSAILVGRMLPELNEGQKRESSEKDLLLSHLESGYPELFIELQSFRRTFNAISEEVLKSARAIATSLNEPSLLPQYGWGQSTPNWCNYVQGAADFVNSAYQKWRYPATDWPPVKIIKAQQGQDTFFTVQWMNNIAYTKEEASANEFRSRLERLESSSHPTLEQAFESVSKLSTIESKIRGELEVIRVKVSAGVPLRGSCSAGIEADPKFE